MSLYKILNPPPNKKVAYDRLASKSRLMFRQAFEKIKDFKTLFLETKYTVQLKIQTSMLLYMNVSYFNHRIKNKMKKFFKQVLFLPTKYKYK